MSNFIRLPMQWALIALAVFSAQLLAKAPEPLEHSAEQGKTTSSIVRQLSKKHYREQSLDDAMSARYLENYLKMLDPAKSFFFQADVNKLNEYSESFDDWLARGELDQAFAIFNIYRQRVVTRLESVLADLESEDVEFDFDSDDRLVTDWEQAEWPKDKQTADDFWHKRLKSSLLDLKLAGKSLEDSRELLIKRYNNQLRRVRQQDSEDAFEIIINSLTTLYDPHTNYLSPRTLENFNINMSLSLEGIGAVLQSEDEYTKVTRLVPAGPADKQGELRPTDRIIAVGQGKDGDMADVVGWRLDEVVDLIRGPKDTIVRLEILPAKAAVNSTTKIVSIKRDKVKLEEQAAKSEVFELESGDNRYKLGVLKVPTFYMDFEAYRQRDPNYKSTTRDVLKLLEELEKAQVDGIIVDLRSNGGGSLQEATTLTDVFIDQGPVVQIRQTNELISRNYRSHSKAAYRGPLLVLIDRLSASASEIFAGAIQDYNRGLIVGSQSFGKGSVQSLVPVNQGQLKLTESKFYRVSGDSTQHRGVVPDIDLPSLVDTDEIGESSYDYALPWDKIHPVPHGQYFALEQVLPQLKKEHHKRIQQNPDFIYLQERQALFKDANEEDSISLSEETRLEEKNTLEAQLLNLENKRRKIKGLDLYENFAAIGDDKTDQADAGKGQDADGSESQSEEDLVDFSDQAHSEINPEKDPFLIEAGYILMDFIEALKAQRQDDQRVANF